MCGYQQRGYRDRISKTWSISTSVKMTIEKMEKSNEFDISKLGTEKQSHYTVLGWEQALEPIQIAIDWNTITLLNIDAEWHPASDVLPRDMELLLGIYSDKPRIYQIDCYFRENEPPTNYVYEHLIKTIL